VIEFLVEYGLFFAKSITVVIAFAAIIMIIAAASSKSKKSQSGGEISVTHFNESLDDMKESLESEILDLDTLKAMDKADKQREKQEKKEKKAKLKATKKQAKPADSEIDEAGKRVFVVDFDGDIAASDVEPMREEITALLTLARPEKDEVVVRLESSGGMVHSYGLASSQLERIKRKSLPLTVCVDRVAASGGYMMACLGDKIIAAPFAILGSIGVVAQLPNFHRVLKKYDVDYETLTAGEYKRTMTMLGENTEKGRQKFQEELEDTHVLFKDFVKEFRPVVNIEEVATGEVWFGKRALDVKLVDELMTSDEYLAELATDADVYLIRYEQKQTLADKVSSITTNASDNLILRWVKRLQASRNIQF